MQLNATPPALTLEPTDCYDACNLLALSPIEC
jgi:hypothetical protein